MSLFGNSKDSIEKLESDGNVQELINAFVEGDQDTSWKAAQALGRIKDRRSVEPLIELLAHGDNDIRWNAAKN